MYRDAVCAFNFKQDSVGHVFRNQGIQKERKLQRHYQVHVVGDVSLKWLRTHWVRVILR